MGRLKHGTECRGRRPLRATALLTLLIALLSAACLAAPGAMAADSIYWTTPYAANEIYVARLDGSSSAPGTLDTGTATVSAAVAAARSGMPANVVARCAGWE